MTLVTFPTPPRDSDQQVLRKSARVPHHQMPIRIVQFTTVRPTLTPSSTRSTMVSRTHLHLMLPLVEVATRLCPPRPILLRTRPMLPLLPLLLQRHTGAQPLAERKKWSPPIHTTGLTQLVSAPVRDMRSDSQTISQTISNWDICFSFFLSKSFTPRISFVHTYLVGPMMA